MEAVVKLAVEIWQRVCYNTRSGFFTLQAERRSQADSEGLSWQCPKPQGSRWQCPRFAPEADLEQVHCRPQA
eukprot:11135392-Lingulodinium_polyedra.AAC.1